MTQKNYEMCELKVRMKGGRESPNQSKSSQNFLPESELDFALTTGLKILISGYSINESFINDVHL